MKFTVTEVLVSYIKNIRKEQKISVTEFSKKIGKSKSYITKFDNCEFKTLTLEDFNKIFEALASFEASSEKLMDEYFLMLDNNDYINRNIDLSIDFSNYCNVVKQYEIKEILIDKLLQMFKEENLTIHEIVAFANENTAVQEFSNFDQVEFNEFVISPLTSEQNDDFEENNGIQGSYIKVKLDEDYVNRIFNKEVNSTSYYILLAVAHSFYLQLLSEVGSETFRTKKEIIAGTSASNLLFNFQFCSLADTKKIIRKKEILKKLSDNLDEISNSMQLVSARYINLITQIYNQNPFYIEDKIKSFDRNLKADAGFCVATWDLPLYKVKNLNTETKKRLLKELSETIERYASDEENQEQIELI